MGTPLSATCTTLTTSLSASGGLLAAAARGPRQSPNHLRLRGWRTVSPP